MDFSSHPRAERAAEPLLKLMRPREKGGGVLLTARQG